mmetsp:Transcript_29741/g.95625  ORF Transcript_29741/g.95625 Transcript_29741/m.95625 type:complete len:162 (+) Transcript_29741:74-559(+)
MGGSIDERCEKSALEEAVSKCTEAPDIRALLVPGLDHNLKVPKGNMKQMDMLNGYLVDSVLKFVKALNDGEVGSCGLPKVGADGTIAVLELTAEEQALMKAPAKGSPGGDGEGEGADDWDAPFGEDEGMTMRPPRRRAPDSDDEEPDRKRARGAGVYDNMF